MAKSNSIFADWKLRLTTNPVASGAKPPMFAVSIFNKNPQFVVYPNHDNGSGVTFIPASMDAKTFYTVMQMVSYLADRVLNSDGNIAPVKYKWDNKTQIPREQRSDPKVSMKVVSETWVGVDEKGVWISVKDANNAQAPLVQFHFGSDYYHPLSGKDLQDQWKSAHSAKAWVELNGKLMINVLDRAGAKDPDAQQGGNGGGYKGNNNGYNKGGNKPYGNNGGNKPYGNNNGGGNKSYGAGGSGGGDSFDQTDEFDDGDFA